MLSIISPEMVTADRVIKCQIGLKNILHNLRPFHLNPKKASSVSKLKLWEQNSLLPQASDKTSSCLVIRSSSRNDRLPPNYNIKIISIVYFSDCQIEPEC